MKELACWQWYLSQFPPLWKAYLLDAMRDKLVTNLRNMDVTNLNRCELVTFLLHTDQNFVNDFMLIGLHGCTAVMLRVSRWHVSIQVQWRSLPNQNIVSRDSSSWKNKTIIIKLAILSLLHPTCTVLSRLFEDFWIERSYGANGTSFLLISAAMINCRLIPNQGIFPVVCKCKS